MVWGRSLKDFSKIWNQKKIWKLTSLLVHPAPTWNQTHNTSWSVRGPPYHYLLQSAGPTEGLSGYPLKLYFQIPCIFPVFFPVRPQIFPVPIYTICDYYIHKTDLADLSSFWKKKRFFFTANIAMSFTFRIRAFTNSITFPNSLCFPW